MENGGALVATHLTSVADEYGQPRENFALADLFGARLRSLDPVEAPDLYMRLPSSELIPQDPQIVLVEALPGAKTACVTYDLARRRELGPAVITRRQGRGTVIYIASSLEAVYEETRMKPLRAWFASLLLPILKDARTYEIEFRPGLLPHFTASEDDLVLHLLANTGNKLKNSGCARIFCPSTMSRFASACRAPGRSVRRTFCAQGSRCDGL